MGNKTNYCDKCINLIVSRGVLLDDICDCVMLLQEKYNPGITRETVDAVIMSVLNKREVQNAILTGICLDIAADKNVLESKELTEILVNDNSLYGVDEVLAYGICNLYGSIALTNYGYIDRLKPLVIGRLNENHNNQCNTFLDDIIGAIAAAAASKIAHSDDGGKDD